MVSTAYLTNCPVRTSAYVETITPARPAHSDALLAVALATPFLSQMDATITNAATPAIRTGRGAPHGA
jgi:hypothetical protein